jgi:hypothetical protein
VYICDPGHCFWPNLVSGFGTVHTYCGAGPRRSSRLLTKYISC